MSIQNPVKDIFAIQMYGKSGLEDYQTAEIEGDYAYTEQGRKFRKSVMRFLEFFGLYQRRMTKRGQRIIKIKSYTYVVTNTPAQQIQRQKFKDACNAWNALNSEQKNYWTMQARKTKLNAQALYRSKYMKGEI